MAAAPGERGTSPAFAARRGTLQLVQVFRGAAAVMVMLYHVSMVNRFYAPFLGNAFGFGHSGIDFFFVLSGFIMLYVHYGQAGAARRTGRFLALRAVRIFPIYWCVLGVTVVSFWVFPQGPDFVWAPAKTLEPATLTRAVLLYHQDQDAILPVAWTLSYELVFYLFFSLFFLCGARVFGLLMLAWSVAIAVQWSGVRYLGPYPVLLRPVVAEFFLGCLAALLARRLGAYRIAGWWLILPIGIVVRSAGPSSPARSTATGGTRRRTSCSSSSARCTTNRRGGVTHASSCCSETPRIRCTSCISVSSCRSMPRSSPIACSPPARPI